MSPAVDRVLAGLEKVRKNGDGWEARCPAHDDRNPSLAVKEGDDGRVLLNCHAGCSTEAVVEALGLAMADLFPPRPQKPQKRARYSNKPADFDTLERLSRGGLTLKRYAEHFQLPAAFLEGTGLEDATWQGRPAVKIPYRDVAGTEVATRYRIGLAGDRFRWEKGSKPQLYGLPALAEARKASHVLIVEGESDVHTLRFHGIPALGVPGVDTWRAEWAEHFDGIETVYVIQEPDQAGRKLVEKLAGSKLADRVRVVRLDGAKDAADLHRATPEPFIETLERALVASCPALGYRTIRASEVEIEPVDWVWYPRIPSSALTILAGDGGAGKSQIGVELEARITRGDPFPGDNASPTANGPANVLIVSGEDTFKHVTVPRLRAAGADLNRAHLLDLGVTEWIDLDKPEDMKQLEDTVARVRPAWVRFDPLASYLGDTDSYKDPEVRRTLGPLALIAEKYGCVILAVIHLSKGDKKPIDRILGSVAFRNLARSVLMAGLVPDDPDESSGVVFHEKCNLAKKAEPITYQIVSETAYANDGTPVPTSRIEWGGESDLTAEHVFGRSGTSEPSKLAAAEAFLLAELKNGPVKSETIKRDAEDQGHKWRTVERAKEEMKKDSSKPGIESVQPEKIGEPWSWKLVPNGPKSACFNASAAESAKPPSPPSGWRGRETQEGSGFSADPCSETAKGRHLAETDESGPENVSNSTAPEQGQGASIVNSAAVEEPESDPWTDDDRGEIDDGADPEPEPTTVPDVRLLSEDDRAVVRWLHENPDSTPGDARDGCPVFGGSYAKAAAWLKDLHGRGFLDASGSVAAPRYRVREGVLV